jgi:hypothetical protein
MTCFLKTRNWQLETGLRRSRGIEAFRKYFKDNVTAGAVAVDVWEHYHCNFGEIHCGTATVRSLPHIPPWWERDELKTKWEDER